MPSGSELCHRLNLLIHLFAPKPTSAPKAGAALSPAAPPPSPPPPSLAPLPSPPPPPAGLEAGEDSVGAGSVEQDESASPPLQPPPKPPAAKSPPSPGRRGSNTAQPAVQKHIIITQDFHPAGHKFFASSNNEKADLSDFQSGWPVRNTPYGLQVSRTIVTQWLASNLYPSLHADVGVLCTARHVKLQTLWPDHAIQGTEGCEFVKELRIPDDTLVIRKGFRSDVDSYSAFFEIDR